MYLILWHCYALLCFTCNLTGIYWPSWFRHKTKQSQRFFETRISCKGWFDGKEVGVKEESKSYPWDYCHSHEGAWNCGCKCYTTASNGTTASRLFTNTKKTCNLSVYWFCSLFCFHCILYIVYMYIHILYRTEIFSSLLELLFPPPLNVHLLWFMITVHQVHNNIVLV